MNTTFARRAAAARGPAALLIASAVTLGGCGDGSGGTAGDDGFGGGGFAPSPIEPFVGVYDLTGSWDGQAGDAAFLVIRPVDEDGESRVLLYDLDDLNGGGNCYFRPPAGGEAVPDPARRTQVFMNRVSPFEDAVLSLSGTTLVIDYFGVNEQPLRYTAPAVGISETDLGPLC